MLAAQSKKRYSQSPAIGPPPRTPVEPVVEKLHGVEVVDAYRWLEDQNSPETRLWLAEQADYTKVYFDGIPHRERIRKRVAELLDVETISMPRRVLNRYFFLQRSVGQEQPAIMMREGAAGQALVLVNPTEATAAFPALNIIAVSGDGQLLAYGVRSLGEDACEVRFLDIERRQSLRSPLPHGLTRGLVFAADGRGFYYSHESTEGDRSCYPRVRWHEFGSNPKNDSEVFVARDGPHSQVILFGSPCGRYLGYYSVHYEGEFGVDLYVHDLDSRRPPQLIVQGIGEGFSPTFTKNGLIACTQVEAPNGRIVEIKLEDSRQDNWREIVPQCRSRITKFAVAGKYVLVTYVDEGVSRIELFDLDGRRYGRIHCPLGQGTLRLTASQPHPETAFYEFESFTKRPTTVALHIPTRQHEVWGTVTAPLDESSIRVERAHCMSTDGVRIPVWLVSKRQHSPKTPLPTILTGYGGFGHCVGLSFSAFATFLVERGCLFAVANVRGGGELGEQWHLAGTRQNRQNSVGDFVSVAEWLLAERRTTPGRLAIAGASNGGLLVAAALTQRPQLFRAALSIGPITDILRYHLFDSAAMWVREYGRAENAADFAFMQAYSPYQGVRNGLPYPASMFVSGDADTRCNPMHARKMVAKLQTATASPHPIILDYRPAWGHTPAQPLTRRIDALTDRLAFICHELDLRV